MGKLSSGKREGFSHVLIGEERRRGSWYTAAISLEMADYVELVAVDVVAHSFIGVHSLATVPLCILSVMGILELRQ